MCPVDANGKYQMNAQIARATPKAGPAAPPAADPADPNAGATSDSVTINKQPDGTFLVIEASNPDGTPFPDFQSAMGKAAECLGASTEPDQDDSGAAPQGADAGVVAG